jgi:RNA polymerase sigma factor (sigma-70 family)
MNAQVALDYDVAAAMEGNRDAFDRLVRQCASMVCSIALAIVRNVDGSEDVAQDVFLAAWRGIGKLRNPASFVPWLRQVTRNRANEWLRENLREVPASELLHAAVDPRLSAVEAILRDEERDLLQRVIDDLPDEAREVVILYYREGSSVRHVAELLGIRDDAVKQRLSRARARIRTEMLEHFGQAVARTAPGAAFTLAVSSAIAVAAPTAAAATLTAHAAGGSKLAKLGLLGSGASLGGAVAIAAVLLGIRSVKKRARTDDQREQLDRFAGTAVLVVILAVLGFIASAFIQPHWVAASLVWIGYVAALGYLYRVRLPRVVAPILAAEREDDPAAALRHRREAIRSWFGFIAGFAAGSAALVWGILH